ncbi:S60 ribosomal protein L31 [Heterostelium album PN500]|uniref:S60 ribosomal protein L31 n=1 Tax=Heterostelium pallidum (strain ATCC 26659 / Pp 5 / PN500) TaxID=670386 RepID=D3AZB6_HETP5|nr:S60 ribosomal protein L31 [Heterostelium album PN500]EFA85499.1 S60 ribosomal protein L31 [Heterostelium album PN500]|eukprot:XP_020437607.1 S60 ribosomal protein L31 [Heterostelium album PN500]
MATKNTTPAEKGPITREYTINLHKRLMGTVLETNLGLIRYDYSTFKDRAPKAVKQIRQFAQEVMKTKDVRLDNKLNTMLWSRGIKQTPNRVRIVLSRKRNDDENAREKFYTLASFVPCKSFKGVVTKVVTEN